MIQSNSQSEKVLIRAAPYPLETEYQNVIEQP